MLLFRSISLVAACWLLAAACSSERAIPVGPTTTTDITGGQGGGGSDPGGGGGSGGGAEGGAAGTGGQGGGPDLCGNGALDPNEVCDGDLLGGLDCTSFGFDAGTLLCSDCLADITGCTSPEDCFDGQDNDGDGLRDCLDPDCAAICADPCGNQVILAVPSQVQGDTTGHGNTVDSSCADHNASGPEFVYQVTAPETGVLDFWLTSMADLSLSVRGQCDSEGSEVVCANRTAGAPGTELLTLPVTAGQTLSVVVDGAFAGEWGPYALGVESRVPACGDGRLDAGEQCDDGDTTPGDGCDDLCQVETGEHETQNNSHSGADTIAAGTDWYALISPEHDVDYVSFIVGSANAVIAAQTLDFGDGACAGYLLDTVVDILDTNGSTVLATNDDGGDGSCSLAEATAPAAGTYHVRVRASTIADPVTFGYVLAVSVTP
jgi:cysteine-rich repeat protein